MSRDIESVWCDAPSEGGAFVAIKCWRTGTRARHSRWRKLKNIPWGSTWSSGDIERGRTLPICFFVVAGFRFFGFFLNAIYTPKLVSETSLMKYQEWNFIDETSLMKLHSWNFIHETSLNEFMKYQEWGFRVEVSLVKLHSFFFCAGRQPLLRFFWTLYL